MAVVDLVLRQQKELIIAKGIAAITARICFSFLPWTFTRTKQFVVVISYATITASLQSVDQSSAAAGFPYSIGYSSFAIAAMLIATA